MHWMYGFEGGWLFMILFWVVVVAGIVVLVKWIVGQTSSHPRTDTALDILKKRYARGDITKEDFDHMKKDLE